MPFTFVGDDVVGDRVARNLHREDHEDLYSSDPLWQGFVADGHLRAWQFIQNKVMTRGYTEAQLEAWQRGPDFEKRLGAYYALGEGVVLLENFDYKNLAAEAAKCEKEIMDAVSGGILIDGEFQQPGGVAIDTAGASSGRLLATEETIHGAVRRCPGSGPFERW